MSRENRVKEYRVFVNGREKVWLHDEITFDEIVVLAFGLAHNIVTYTVTYKKGHENRSEGILVKGDVLKVKDGIVFNVTQTNRS